MKYPLWSNQPAWKILFINPLYPLIQTGPWDLFVFQFAQKFLHFLISSVESASSSVICEDVFLRVEKLRERVITVVNSLKSAPEHKKTRVIIQIRPVKQTHSPFQVKEDDISGVSPPEQELLRELLTTQELNLHPRFCVWKVPLVINSITEENLIQPHFKTPNFPFKSLFALM